MLHVYQQTVNMLGHASCQMPVVVPAVMVCAALVEASCA